MNSNTVEVLQIESNDWEKKFDWLKKWAEELDSASLFELYNNLSKGNIYNKRNLELIIIFIQKLKFDDISKLVENNKTSTIKYLKLWIKISKFFPLFRYSVFYLIDKHLDKVIDKIEDEEKNKLGLFFTFLGAIVSFITLVNMRNKSMYISFFILLIFVFIVVLFIKQFIYLGTNIARKRVLKNLGDFLQDENNINEEFLDFVLIYSQKIMDYKGKQRGDYLKSIKRDLDFLLMENKIKFIFKSLWNLIKEYKLEVIISITFSLAIYLVYFLIFKN